MVITDPLPGTQFRNGGTITVKFRYSVSSATPITLDLMQETWGPSILFDSKALTIPRAGDLWNYAFDVPGLVGSNFYIRIKYNCLFANLLCSQAYSEYFYINFTPKIVWTSPSADAIFNPSQIPSITATWVPVGVGSAPTISLMKLAPIDIPVSTTSVNTFSGTASLSAEGGSSLPMFFMISYNCRVLGYFCTNERSPIFHVPVSYSAPVNYNGASATQSYPLWSQECGDCGPGSTGKFCELCDQGYNISASLDCTNCFMTNDVTLSHLYLDIGLQGLVG